ncbi:MAG: hypothetical protein AAB576_08665, partial [Elusimicrobiota bacterium]
MHARAVDNAGNIAYFTAATFTFTTELPESFVAQPGVYALSTFPNSITGTAQDFISVVGTVSVAVTRITDGGWFNGVDFFPTAGGQPTWIKLTGEGICGDPCNWNFDAATLITRMTPGLEYRIISNSTNTALNVENFGLGNGGTGRDRLVVYDQTGPTSRITIPKNLRVMTGGQGQSAEHTYAGIFGTAADQWPGAGIGGVSSVTVSIQQIYPYTAAFWNGLSTFTLAAERYWPVDALTPTGSNTYTWSITTNKPTLETGKKYKVRVAAVDNSSPTQNAEAVISSITFAYEITVPTAIIQVPADNSYVQAVTALSGTAEDLFRVHVTSIAISTYNGQFWDGSNYTQPPGSPVWFTAQEPLTGGPVSFTWSFSSNTFNFQDDKKYTVRNRTEGDSTIRKEGNAVSFTFDNTPPNSDITAPTRVSHPQRANQFGVFLNQLTSITGTALDPNLLPSGAKAGEVTIRDTSGAGAKYWDGSSWNPFNPS